MSDINSPFHEPNHSVTRERIVKAVTTPLGFFVLSILAIETLLALVAGFGRQPEVSTIAIYAMVGFTIPLIVIVAIFAWFRPEALEGKRPDIRNHNRNLRKGDIVRVCCNPSDRSLKFPSHGVNVWKEEMNAYLCQSAKVTSVMHDPFSHYLLDVDNGENKWDRKWLILVE